MPNISITVQYIQQPFFQLQIFINNNTVTKQILNNKYYGSKYQKQVPHGIAYNYKKIWLSVCFYKKNPNFQKTNKSTPGSRLKPVDLAQI